MTKDPLPEILETLKRDPRTAHEYLFELRHEDASPPFHMEMIDLWHSPAPFVQIEAFRGGAKSTRFEEGATIDAILQTFGNGIIIGASEERGIERLAAVKHELTTNDRILEIVGDQQGDKWGEKKIILRNGVCLQAKGRGQSLRGTKHLNMRPDCVFLDDIEQDEEFLPTEEACKKVIDWLFAVVIPGMHPHRRRIRIAGTPGSPYSLTMQLRRAQGWVSRRYPVVYKDKKTGAERATWEARFPLAWVEKERATYKSLGKGLLFEQEYMLNPLDESSQAFNEKMMRVEPLQRSWEPTWAMYDPARTVSARSGKSASLTGRAVWSWIGTKLVVWKIGQHAWMPDQIVDDIFETDKEWTPVQIGVEQNGLNEFIFQPLRTRMVALGRTVPVLSVNAPKGKIDFIKGLQPFFRANEVIFAQELPSEVKQAFLNFPTGAIDAPNALAYALHPQLRIGQPIYQNFGQQHVDFNLTVNQGLSAMASPVFLAVNANKACTTGVLCQFNNGELRILADWVTEDPPATGLRPIVQMANLVGGGRVKVCAGSEHFTEYENVGLRAAANKIPLTVQQTGVAYKGREELRALLTVRNAGQVLVRVSPHATWSLRALSGGYARKFDRRGQLEEFAADGTYKVLMEGLESLLALTNIAEKEADSGRHYAYTRNGARYQTALPGRDRQPKPLKGST